MVLDRKKKGTNREKYKSRELRVESNCTNNTHTVLKPSQSVLKYGDVSNLLLQLNSGNNLKEYSSFRRICLVI